MTKKTRSGAVRKTKKDSGPTINTGERDVLRRLAGRVAELAARPIEQEKIKLWYKLNALEPTRPLVFCSPEGSWKEIITQDQMECESQLARWWERHFRQEIFWGEEICDDRVIEPYFDIGCVHSGEDWGLSMTIIGGGAGGAYTWDAPIKTYDDLKHMHYPRPIVDREETSRIVDLADNAFGDFLEPRMRMRWRWSAGFSYIAACLRGLEQMMLDMLDNPEGLHALMSFLRDGLMAELDYLEENGLLYLNNCGDYVGSGGFGWTNELPQADFDGHVRAIDIWGFGESQETVGVSPELFEEFIFQYQLPILSRFGLNCYGCCEALDARWNIVKKTPRLRRVSISPWSDIGKMAELMQDKYIFSIKPNPSYLAMASFHEDDIRRGLRETFDRTRGCRVEVIMKDTHTIRNDPNRVKRWVQIAHEEAKR